MTLTELVESLPIEERDSIIITADNRVFHHTAPGTDEYVLTGDGELRPIHTDSDIRKSLASMQAQIDQIHKSLGLPDAKPATLLTTLKTLVWG